MLILGHRGGRGEGWPAENSLEAFQRAMREGADGVELDVRLCASGEPVLVHDPTLAHMTNGRDARPVHAVRRSELPKLQGGLAIPDLESALDLCRGLLVNVELKADAPRRLSLVRAVARSLQRMSTVEVVVSSFDPAILLAMSAAAPKVARGMLVGPRTPRLATAMPLALRRIVAAAHLEDALLTPERAERLRRGGLRVVAWTVNEPARATALRTMGVEWLITDRPATMVKTLRS